MEIFQVSAFICRLHFLEIRELSRRPLDLVVVGYLITAKQQLSVLFDGLGFFMADSTPFVLVPPKDARFEEVGVGQFVV